MTSWPPQSTQGKSNAVTAHPVGRFACAIAILFASGCSSYLPEVTPFGSVNAPDENRSLNGLGLHRDMWESAGVKCIRPQKLSPRMRSVDTIVLVGQTFSPPGQSARDWLVDWLGEKPGRSVVYFGRDFNAESYYLEKTLPNVAPELKQEGAVEAARVEGRELKKRISAFSEDTFCQWFYVDIARPRVVVQSFKGPWANQLTGLRGSWPVRTVLQPPDADDWQSKPPTWIAAAPTKQNNYSRGETYFERSVWSEQEFATQSEWDDAFEFELDSEILLESTDGTPLVYRLTNDAFVGSQLLIVANGAPFLNATAVEPLHRAVATQIIEECLPTKRTALFAYGDQGILISEISEQDSRGAGLEMFLVWPLSVLTVPVAILAVVACVAMLPILGRPQRLKARSVRDFGLHVDALGRLLYETRDWHFAGVMIDTYFRRLRREAPPGWVTSLLDRPSAKQQAGQPIAPQAAASSVANMQSSADSSSPQLQSTADAGNSVPASPPQQSSAPVAPHVQPKTADQPDTLKQRPDS